MIMKKHALSSKVLFFKDVFLEFDYNMILNSNINNLQKYQALQVLENPTQQIVILSFNSYSDYNSLNDLIKMKQFNLSMLKILINQVEILNRELESYLLDINKVNFDPASVIFNEAKKSFLFRYIPSNNFCSNYDLLAMYRFVAFETQLIDYAFLKEDTCLSLSILLDQSSIKEKKSGLFKLNKILNYHNKFAGWHKQKRENTSVSLSPKNTTQRMNYPILFDKTHPEHSIKIFFDHNIIGREETCNIRIDDVSISRQHAQLITLNNQFKLIDLNSTNGTYVNREPIDETMVVNGDIIQIGNKEFIFIR